MVRPGVLCVALLAGWTLPAITLAGSTQTAVTAAPPWRWPANPITSHAQLDAYRRDTPAAASPLSAFTPAGLRRFLASLAFTGNGLGAFSVDDLRYDLTREQAWNVLRLFGAQGYDIGLAARTRPRNDARLENPALEGAYDRLAKGLQGDPGGASLEPLYAEAFAPTQARAASVGDRDLELLFRAAAILATVRPQSPGYLADVRRDFARLEQRGRVDRPHAKALYDVLLADRREDEARALAARHAALGLQPPPAMRSARLRAGQPSVWVAGDKHELWRLPLMLHDAAQVVILGSPHCRYSHDAARDIDADPALRQVFRAHAQWVAPASDIVNFEAMQAWNGDHPAQQLAILQDDDELPFAGSLRTPVFYFLRRGHLEATLVGWPGPEQRDALRQRLAEVGLLPSPREAR